MRGPFPADYETPPPPRPPWWWHFVYSPHTLSNWIMLALALLALALLAIFALLSNFAG